MNGHICMISMNCNKNLHLHPYKTTVFIEYTVATYCGKNGVNWYLHMVYDGQTDATLILFGNKAWFHSNGYADSQNNRKLHVNSPNTIT